MSRTLDLADQLLDGQLRRSVLAWRDEGLSFYTIATRLQTEHAVAVSPDTVRRWVARFVPTTPEVAAS